MLTVNKINGDSETKFDVHVGQLQVQASMHYGKQLQLLIQKCSDVFDTFDWPLKRSVLWDKMHKPHVAYVSTALKATCAWRM